MTGQRNYSFQPVEKEIQSCHYLHWDYPNQLRYYHRHDAYEIYLFIRGNTNMYLEQACYHMEPGDLVIINPTEMHRSACLDDQVYERAFINVKQTALDRLSTRRTNLSCCFESHPLGQKNLTHLSKDQMNHFIDLADKLSAALESRGYGQDVLIDAYLSEILVFVNTMYQNSSYLADNIMPELVRNVMSYIEEHITETITLEELSRHFYLSGTYISRQFKEHTGLTLRHYILDRKIAIAKALLLEGKNVSEACYLSGFSDYANFIRSFTKLVGTTPGHVKSKLNS